MEMTDTVKRLDDEVKVIKNEIQAVLLDIREAYLNRENPFNPEVSAPTISSVVAASMMGTAGGGGAAGGTSANKKEKSSEETDKKDDDSSSNKLSTASEETVAKETNKPEETANMTAKEQIAQEGVKEGAWGSELKPASSNASHNGHNGHNGKIDLSFVVEMTQWVDDAVKKLGYEKTEAILDVAEIVGHLKPELKAILIKFAKRVPVGDGTASPSTRDYIGTLIKLEGLLGMNSKSDEVGLLSIFCQEV